MPKKKQDKKEDKTHLHRKSRKLTNLQVPKKKQDKKSEKKNRKFKKKRKIEEYNVKNTKKIQKKKMHTLKFGVKILHLPCFATVKFFSGR